MKSSNKKWILGLGALAMAFGIGASAMATIPFASAEENQAVVYDLQGVDKIEDMSYTFGAEDEGNEKANEFIDKLSIVELTPEADGEIGVTDEGYVQMNHNALGQYYRTQFEFGAENLTNYTVMMEVEVFEGSFVLGVRIPQFEDFTMGNTVYLQFAKPSGDDGVYVSMVRRTTNEEVTNEYSAYFLNYGVASSNFCLRLVVDGGRISILIDDKEVLYNAYYVDDYKQQDMTIDGYENYDKTVATSGGDFIMAVMNDVNTDIAKTVIKRFAFYNGATAEENVAFNYGDTLEGSDYEEAVKKAEKDMLFTGNFYIPFKAEIGLFKPYDGVKTFKAGDKIRINIAEYINTNVTVDELSVTELANVGKYENGVWEYTFTEEDYAAGKKDFKLMFSHPKADRTISLNVSLTAAAEDTSSDEKGCKSVLSVSAGSVCLLMAGTAFLWKKKKEN